MDNVTHTWAQAFQKIADLNAANFAGHSDWRLPNVIELESLAVFGKVTSRPPGPHIPAVDSAFDNGTDSFTRSTGYWSSTTGLSLTGQANGVNFLQGNVYFLSKEQPFANGGVRAVRVPVDGTAPTISLMTPPDGAVYAQNQVVNADYSCQDEAGGSGLASCVGNVASGAPIDTVTLGAHTFTVTATDNAGNTSTVTHHYMVVDVTPPTITLTTPPQGAAYLLNQVVNADYACQDEAGGSGLASCVGTVANGAAINTATVGAKTFTVTAADNAGNSRSLTHDYSVIYNFSGFFPPIDNLPVLNRMNAGAAAPVKFSLGGYQGLAIFAAGYPRSEWIACDSTALVDGVEQALTAGSSSLSYDPNTDVYTYVWKRRSLGRGLAASW